jgi:hypothetical protein
VDPAELALPPTAHSRARGSSDQGRSAAHDKGRPSFALPINRLTGVEPWRRLGDYA